MFMKDAYKINRGGALALNVIDTLITTFVGGTYLAKIAGYIEMPDSLTGFITTAHSS